SLEAQGNGVIQWNGQTVNPLVTGLGGTYTVMVTNPCGVLSQQVNVIETQLPSVQFLGNQPLGLCAGQLLSLAVQSNVPVQWSTGTVGLVEQVSAAGQYIAVGSNACGQDSLVLDVFPSSVQVQLEASPLSGISPVSIAFTPHWSGADTVFWDVPI